MMFDEPALSYGALLWRRVRLRLDARAAAAARRGEVRRSTRLGALAAILGTMAEEESARREWVRYHLALGNQEEACRMGWEPPAPAVEAEGQAGEAGGADGRPRPALA